MLIFLALTNVASATMWILSPNGTISNINLMTENVSIVDGNGMVIAYADVKVLPITIPTPVPTPVPTISPTPIPSLGTFQTPTFNQVFDYWNRTDTLLTNSVIQNPDGSWGGGYAEMEPTSICTSTHPLMRETAHAVIGYLHAYNLTHNETYKLKAVNGLNYILNEQLPNGGFNWYCSATDIYANLYETGLGGRALAEGYLILGDTRYLTASGKAIEYEKYLGTDSGNANFNGFPISHMVKHYEATKDVNTLNTAIMFTKTMIAAQTVNGYWSDSHNQIYYYQMIMTRALIQVDSIIPSTHPDKVAISTAKDRAVNYIVTHQNTDGSMWYNPTIPVMNGENEDYFTEVINGNSITEDTIEGLIQFQLNNPNTGIYTSTIPTGSSWREGFEMKPMLAGYVLEYYANKNGIVFEIPTPTPIPTVSPTPTPTPSGLKAYWNFNENTGTIAQDSTGINTAYLKGATWAPGKYGSAVRFNGISDLVDAGSDSSLNLMNDMTLEAWIYPTGWGNPKAGRIVSKFNALTDKGYTFYIYDKEFPHDLRTSFGYRDLTHVSNVLNLSMWQHVAFTFNGTHKTFYVNGVAFEPINISPDGTLTPSGDTTGTNFTIGYGTNIEMPRYFEGVIDEVRVYDRALMQDEILNDMNNGVIVPTPVPTPIITPIPTPTPTPISTPTPTVTPIPTSNLLQNPGFEEVPLKWTLITQNGNTPIIDTTSHTGSKSVKISSSTTVISGYPKSDNIAVSPLTTYTISAYGKLQNAAGETPLVRVVELDANKNWVKQTNLPVFGTGTIDWTQKTLNLTTKSNTVYMYVYANIWGGSGNFWVDDVEVKLKT